MSPYDQYLEQSILTASPLELVRALYRHIAENVREAQRCVAAGDIEARGKAVSKATNAILELLTSLNHEQGGALSQNLGELYGYMASRLLQGHMDQDKAPFEEVEKLVVTLLDGWENMDADRTESMYGIVSNTYSPVSASF